MKRHQTTKPLKLLGLLAALIAMTLLAGCSEDTPLAPAAATTETAPTLPDPAKLTVDLDFFADGEQAAKTFGRENFFNAYLRAVIVDAMTKLVLAPPVAAFSLALHTVPNHQPDGSWLWVYTFVNGDEEAQVRLRGVLDGEMVHWEMRVTIHDEHHDLDQALWFDGYTTDEGDTGHWTFYELELPDAPAAANLDWSHATAHHELRLEALLGEDAGDNLTFSVTGTEHRIDFDEGDTDAVWFIRWNAADGTGSLLVPDYNYGEEACWDEQQYDVECAG